MIPYVALEDVSSETMSRDQAHSIGTEGESTEKTGKCHCCLCCLKCPCVSKGLSLYQSWRVTRQQPQVRVALLIWSVVAFALKLTWAIYVSLQVSKYYGQMNDIQRQLDALQQGTSLVSQQQAVLHEGVATLQSQTSNLQLDVQASLSNLASVNQQLSQVNHSQHDLDSSMSYLNTSQRTLDSSLSRLVTSQRDLSVSISSLNSSLSEFQSELTTSTSLLLDTMAGLNVTVDGEPVMAAVEFSIECKTGRSIPSPVVSFPYRVYVTSLSPRVGFGDEIAFPSVVTNMFCYDKGYTNGAVSYAPDLTISTDGRIFCYSDPIRKCTKPLPSCKQLHLIGSSGYVLYLSFLNCPTSAHARNTTTVANG